MSNAAANKSRACKTRIAAFAAAVLLAASAFLLAGCASQASSTAEEKPVTASSYMVSLTQAAEELSADLSGFAEAAADGNLTSMQVKAESAFAKIDDMNDLEAPEELNDVKTKYAEATDSLKSTLNDYLSLYLDIENAPEGTFDFATYTDRIEAIQKQYDEGLNLLEEADKMAAEM